MQSKNSKGVKRNSGSIATVVSLRNWRTFGTRVHGKQFGGADILAFPFERLDDRRPRRRRDAFSRFPFADNPMTLANINGHRGNGVPTIEQGFEVFHGRHNERYKLSRQGRTAFTVRQQAVTGDNRLMGRARSPVQFNKEIAERTKAARVAAGYGNLKEFAKLMLVDYERYKKWESGRTPIQHEYVERFCELTGKDANYLYGFRPVEQESVRRVG